MSKAFDIHTLIRKLLQTNFPGTIIKFIANYINYTTYINHTSRQRQFKTGVPQGGVLHYLRFIPQTYQHPIHRSRSWPTQTTSPSHPHTHTSAAKKYIQQYIHQVFAWTKLNLILNPDKQLALCSRRTLQNIRESWT